MNKKAFITGVAGQDGLYMSSFLLEKGYDVYGMIQREAHFDRKRLDPIRNYAKKNNMKYELCYGDMQDNPSLYKLLSNIKPDEIYNFASQSHVHLSHEEPELTTRVNSNAVLSILDAVNFLKIDCKYYQACSSELFGDPVEVPQTEKTPFQPNNPYAISKLYSYWITKYYRDHYNMFTCNGILYNHESPLRGENFVTRKITYSLARIKAGLQDTFYLGNYDSQRDWGFAGDYVQAMWKMLQQDKPDDYLIASGESHSVREFVEYAANYAGFNLIWEGAGVNEIGVDKSTGKTIVAVNETHYRPCEKNKFVGNPEKAKRILNWEPEVKFNQLVEIMMEADLKN